MKQAIICGNCKQWDRLLVFFKTKKCQLGTMEDGFARTFTIWVQQVLSITKDCALVAFPAYTNTLITIKVDIHQDTSVSRELIYVQVILNAIPTATVNNARSIMSEIMKCKSC